MAKVWKVVILTRGSGWGIPPAILNELGTAIQNAEAVIQTARSSGRTPAEEKAVEVFAPYGTGHGIIAAYGDRGKTGARQAQSRAPGIM